MEVKTIEMKKIALALLIAGILALQGCSGGGKPPENHDVKTGTGTRTGSAEEPAGSMKITIPDQKSHETKGKAKLSLQGEKQTEKGKTLPSGGLLSGRTSPEEKTADKTAAKEDGETSQAKDQKKKQTPAGEEQTESSAGDSGEKTKAGKKKKKKKKPAGDVEIRLGFAGDLNLSEGWETTEFMDEQADGISGCFSADILKTMRGFDLFMLNNEFTYSLRGEPQAKSYTFRADPDRVKNLDTLGVDLVLVANNHIKDYGEESLLDTLDTLDRAKIERVGAGRNIKEAAAPVLYKVNGHKIAYVAASCAEEHEDTIWTSPATEDSPGIMGCYDPEPFYQAVRNAAQKADYVIASVHWGYEYLEYYTEEQEAMARGLVAAGADAVIGTHPHILQGIKLIDGVPVFYSLGNFWFNGEDLMTGMAELTLQIPADPEAKPQLIKTRFIPCTQRGLYTSEASDPGEREQILQHMRDISFGTEIEADGTILTQE